MVNDLRRASDSGRMSILSLLDLLAAFDTIDHSILIIKNLRATFGCSGTVLDWLSSYLSCRNQSVFVGHESIPSVLKCGVSQSSVLGPLLLTCVHILSVLSFVRQVSLSLQMVPSFRTQEFLQIFQLLPAVYEIVLKMSLYGRVTES